MVCSPSACLPASPSLSLSLMVEAWQARRPHRSYRPDRLACRGYLHLHLPTVQDVTLLDVAGPLHEVLLPELSAIDQDKTSDIGLLLPPRQDVQEACGKGCQREDVQETRMRDDRLPSLFPVSPLPSGARGMSDNLPISIYGTAVAHWHPPLLCTWSCRLQWRP